MENLKAILGEEVFNTHVAPKLGTEKKYFFGEGEFIPKGRFDEVNTQAKTYKETLTERDKQLETLSSQVKGNEGLSKELEALRAQNAKQSEEYQAQLSARERDYALDSELTRAKARNSKAVKSLLSMEKIVVKDGKIEGLSEQLEALKKSDAYLFEVDNTVPGKAGNPIVPPIMGNNSNNPQAKTQVKSWNKLKQNR